MESFPHLTANRRTSFYKALHIQDDVRDAPFVFNQLLIEATRYLWLSCYHLKKFQLLSMKLLETEGGNVCFLKNVTALVSGGKP